MLRTPPLYQYSDHPQLAALLQWLLDESGSVDFVNAMAAPWVDALLPEWRRLCGSDNTQHKTHDFTLDVHTAYVLAKTKESPHYQALTLAEKRAVVLAALFHDIAKDGGRPEEKEALTPDWYHPQKSSHVVWKRLPQWGCSMAETELVMRLVYHHQVFGRLITKTNQPNQMPEVWEFQRLALCLQTEETLNALLALTEGDIRSVKANDALFTPIVADKLTVYGEKVRHHLRLLSRTRVYIHLSSLDACSLTLGATEPMAPRVWHLKRSSLLSKGVCLQPYLDPADERLSQQDACLCQFPQIESLQVDYVPCEKLLELIRRPKPWLWVDLLPEYCLKPPLKHPIDAWSLQKQLLEWEAYWPEEPVLGKQKPLRLFSVNRLSNLPEVEATPEDLLWASNAQVRAVACTPETQTEAMAHAKRLKLDVILIR
jgi:hypothetical protein